MIRTQGVAQDLRRDLLANKDNMEAAIKELGESKSGEEPAPEKVRQLEENVRMFERLDAQLDSQLRELQRRLTEDEVKLRKARRGRAHVLSFDTANGNNRTVAGTEEVSEAEEGNAMTIMTEMRK